MARSRFPTKSFSITDDPLDVVLRPPPDESPEDRAERLREEAEARKISDDIDESIRLERAAWKKNKDLFKLLLLGQSESGKSTTLKNFQLTFAPQAWQTERASWRTVVQLNLVRSVNLILDALAHEMAANPSAQARPRTSPFSAPVPPQRPSMPSPDTPAGPLSGLGPSRYTAPLEFTDKHALLKLRLAPLRYVENDLRQFLGAASWEVTAENLVKDTHATSFGDPHQPRPRDLYLRSNRSWRDALHTQYAHGVSERGGGGAGAVPVPGRDDATEVIAGCREDIKALWEDPVIREMLERQRMRIEESAGFFLDNVDRIATRTYEPSDDDVVRSRLRTVGVQEYRLRFEKEATMDMGRMIAREWIIYDVGGTRSSRSAWVPYFEDANALLFLAPISCFDETLAENPRVNRLEDSVTLWKSIVSSKLLRRCIIVLFLNKYDLLARKLKGGVRISKYLSSFGDRENTAPVLAKYLHQKFREHHKECSPDPRSFYGYVTCVVDTQATASTLASVRDGLLRQHLQRADLVS